MATASTRYSTVEDIVDSNVHSTPVYVKCYAGNDSDIGTLSLALSNAGISREPVTVQDAQTPPVCLNPTLAFDASSSTDDIFEHVVQPAIDDVMAGYNSTLWVISSPGSGERELLSSTSRTMTNGMLHKTAACLLALSNNNSGCTSSDAGPTPRYSLSLSLVAEFHGAMYDIMAEDRAMQCKRRVRELPGESEYPYVQDQMWMAISSVEEAHRIISDLETRLQRMTCYMGHRITDVQPTWQWRLTQERNGVPDDVKDGDDDDDDDWCVVGAVRGQERITTLSLVVYYAELHRRRWEQHGPTERRRFTDMTTSCLSRVVRALVAKREYQEKQKATSASVGTADGGTGEGGPAATGIQPPKPQYIHVPYRDDIVVRLHRASLGGPACCRVLCVASVRSADEHAVSQLLQLTSYWARVQQRPLVTPWRDREEGTTGQVAGTMAPDHAPAGGVPPAS